MFLGFLFDIDLFTWVLTNLATAAADDVYGIRNNNRHFGNNFGLCCPIAQCVRLIVILLVYISNGGGFWPVFDANQT